MDIKILQTDGQFIDLTKGTIFTDYTEGIINKGAAIKIQDESYFSDPVVTINDRIGSPLTWDESTSSWSTKNDLHMGDASYDYYGYNVIIMDREETGSDRRAYFCKDNEIINLPEYTGAYTRFRLNSHVNKNKFPTFQTINNSNTNYLLLPLGVVSYMNGSTRMFEYVGLLRNKDTGEIRMGTSSGPSSAFSIATPSNTKISVARYTIYKDTTIPDLEERVHDLENAVISMQNTLAEHSKILKDLPAVVAAVSSDVSKLYVAR